MEAGRVQKISELCSKVVNPTEAEILELYGESVGQAVFGLWGGTPGEVIFTSTWAEFSRRSDSTVINYLTCQLDFAPYSWEFKEEVGEECNGYYVMESGVGDWVGCSPSLRSLLANFSPHVVDKIVRHLDPATGDSAKGEVRCIGIQSVLWNDTFVGVFYNIEKPDGTKGTKFMRFYTFTHAMRCLVLTDAERGKFPDVLLIDQYCRGRGKWTPMCPAGGENEGDLAAVLRAELLAEVGVTLDEKCSVYSLGEQYLDDVMCSDPVSLMVVTGVTPVAGHHNPAEGIRRVLRMPWHDFVSWALSFECDDVWSTYFALRCIWDAENGWLCIRGPFKSVMI
jgi:hypothetical protein